MPRIEPFETAFDDWQLQGDHYHGSVANHALYLHGAGTSSRTGYTIPRTALAERGIGTTAFDCIGHGATGGTLAQSSVASRTRQAQAVLAGRAMQGPLALLGSSMGAYNAIKLAELLPAQVQSLVLIVPGVYTPTAYELAFGPAFSNVIRRERSWADSDAWDILAGFTGKLLVIAAQHDDVIPIEIPERLVASAVQARQRKLLVVEGARHNHLFGLLRDNPPQLQETIDLIAECVQIAH